MFRRPFARRFSRSHGASHPFKSERSLEEAVFIPNKNLKKKFHFENFQLEKTVLPGSLH